jgi:chemotaxis protein histidine kinase CheA
MLPIEVIVLDSDEDTDGAGSEPEEGEIREGAGTDGAVSPTPAPTGSPADVQRSPAALAEAASAAARDAAESAAALAAASAAATSAQSAAGEAADALRAGRARSEAAKAALAVAAAREAALTEQMAAAIAARRTANAESKSAAGALPALERAAATAAAAAEAAAGTMRRQSDVSEQREAMRRAAVEVAEAAAAEAAANAAAAAAAAATTAAAAAARPRLHDPRRPDPRRLASAALPPAAPHVPTVRVFVYFRGATATATNEEVLAAFRPFGGRCAHCRDRPPPHRAFASVHLACSAADAEAACRVLDGRPLGGGGIAAAAVSVRVAPPTQQTPCTAPRCPMASAAPAADDCAAFSDAGAPSAPPPPAGGGALKRARHAAAPYGTDDAMAAADAAPPARLLTVTLAPAPGGAPPRPPAPAGILSPEPRHPSAHAAAALLHALNDIVKGCAVADTGYAAAMALAADAAHAGALGGGGAGCVLRCTPRDGAEAAELATLPFALSARAGGGDEADAPDSGWRLMLSALPAPLPDAAVLLPPGLPPPRLLHARLCSLGALRAWQWLLPERRLACALDLDETVVRAYRLGDLALAHETMRLEAEAARRTAAGLAVAASVASAAGPPSAAAASAAAAVASTTAAEELASRVECAACWLRHLEAFAVSGRVPALSRWASPAATFPPGSTGFLAAPPAVPAAAPLGASATSAAASYTAYRVPPGAGAGLGCDACLCRVGGEALLVCVRPGWGRLREVLRARFWTGVATHASLDYAATVARLLDPALAESAKLSLLRGGGEGEHAEWRTPHAHPRLPPSAEDAAAGAAAAPPLLAHIASFRREPEAPPPGGPGFGAPPGVPTLIQKSFGAFRGVLPASNAFVALDDLVGGRGGGAAVWHASDAARVLCLPPFRPFGAPEVGAPVLVRCADALSAVHDAFFARAAPAGDAVACLSAAVREQEAKVFQP